MKEAGAGSHHLYPYITFDDMYGERLHHTYLPQWYIDREKERKKQLEKELKELAAEKEKAQGSKNK